MYLKTLKTLPFKLLEQFYYIAEVIHYIFFLAYFGAVKVLVVLAKIFVFSLSTVVQKESFITIKMKTGFDDIRVKVKLHSLN